VARFFGRYEHSLDAKGRIILPARFRANFDTQLYVSQHLDRCLALWTPEGFELKLAEMEEAAQRGRDERNVARVWSSGSAELELDRQGRIAIPAHLREYARLETAVLVIGVMDRVELWSPSEYATTVQPSVSYLTEGSNLLVTPNVPSN
jgi:MraZ protein